MPQHNLLDFAVDPGEGADQGVHLGPEIKCLLESNLVHPGLLGNIGTVAQILGHFVLKILLHPVENLAAAHLVVIAELLLELGAPVVGSVPVFRFGRAQAPAPGFFFPVLFLLSLAPMQANVHS
jgi:hypothetical protein